MKNQFLRQAWTMMKQHRLFTGMYLAGTAISIAMAMAVIITLYIKLGPIYPEYNRDRTLTIGWLQEKLLDEGYSQFSGVSHRFVESIKNEAKNLDMLCVRWNGKRQPTSIITNEKNDTESTSLPDWVCSNFWKIFDFRFVDGHPFTEKEEEQPVAVITTTLAEKLFARHEVAGEYIRIDTTRYKITGVVEPSATSIESAYTGNEIWASAYYVNPKNSDKDNLHGENTVYMLAKTPQQLDELKEEVMAIFRKEIQQRSKKNSEFNLTIFEHWEHAFYLYKTNGEEAGLFEGIAKYLYAILAFLFIPALNLCGMISTRMNNRLDEIGVRRSYGATKGQIISQVLCENLLLTFIGAILGLLLSYLMVCSGYSWILTLFEKGGHLKVVSGITFEMLFNPTIIAVVLLVTFVLNVASALLPTMIALKKDIVQSLYQRR